MNSTLKIDFQKSELHLNFFGELTLYSIAALEEKIHAINNSTYTKVLINLLEVSYIDTAAAIFIYNIQEKFRKVETQTIFANDLQESTLRLVKEHTDKSADIHRKDSKTFIEKIGKIFYNYYVGFVDFITFFGQLFATKMRYITSFKNMRFKEIAFEINESAIKALGIIALTSFLIGLVVAYQSAYQLKMYGANIFIVDMLGISILRELAPLITAIVIAGRSGSAYTAQIGAMKITQELDAMRTMGFEPFAFLVLPRIIALMITMPILIFVADMMGILGGMIVANIDLAITPDMFLDRFTEVVAAKHFFIGLAKGPFFAFLIASIGIYRGLMVRDDTQSIGFNTTKSVVEAIFAVIVCDAVFSIAFTNLGI
ncbi:ABC transporter permease [Sulfurimonas sp.]